MRKILAIALILWMANPAFADSCSGSGGTGTCIFSTSDSTATVNADIANTAYGHYSWPAGAYSYAVIGSNNYVLQFRCSGGPSGGITYTGAAATFVLGTGVSPTSVLTLSPTNLKGIHVVTPSGTSCHISNLALKDLGFYVDVGSNVLFDHIAVSGILGTGSCSNCRSPIFFEGSGTTGMTSASVTWSTFGPNGSDLVNGVAHSDGNGDSGAVVFHASAYSNNVSNNNWVGPFVEGIKIESDSGNVSTWQNNTFMNDDFNGWHRIGIEVQASVNCSGNTVAYNSFENPYNFDGGTWPQSIVNCAPASPGATTPVAVSIHDNTPIENGTPCSVSGSACLPYNYCAYGIEAWETAPSIANNLIQGCYSTGGIVFGGQTGPPLYQSTAGPITGNIVEGPNVTGGSGPGQKGIECEDGGGPIGTAVCNKTLGISSGLSPSNTNTISATITPITSTAPSVSPATGTYTGPQTVTASDSGTNHSIWCTTDGSAPAPGQGTSFLYVAPFSSGTLPATVKCVGWWGQGGNTLIYPSGYGYVPSSVITRVYSSEPASISISGAVGFSGQVTIQ